jgi:hypothetical protein
VNQYRITASWDGDPAACPRASHRTELIIDAVDARDAYFQFREVTKFDSRPGGAGRWVVTGVWESRKLDLKKFTDE